MGIPPDCRSCTLPARRPVVGAPSAVRGPGSDKTCSSTSSAQHPMPTGVAAATRPVQGLSKDADQTCSWMLKDLNQSDWLSTILDHALVYYSVSTRMLYCKRWLIMNGRLNTCAAQEYRAAEGEKGSGQKGLRRLALGLPAEVPTLVFHRLNGAGLDVLNRLIGDLWCEGCAVFERGAVFEVNEGLGNLWGLQCPHCRVVCARCTEKRTFCQL